MTRTESIQKQSLGKLLSQKLRDYVMLVKFRLSITVVFSAAMVYLFAGGMETHLVVFILAGFLITAASNAINEMIEADTDKLMRRTMQRPLAAGRMAMTEAILATGIMAVSGILLMWYFFNPLAALLGALSLLSYGFIYTPAKKMSPAAVFIGAFPGAIPPVIGWAAATGGLNNIALIFFAIQFIWQFPHFWSIAWVAYDDYAKAGFYLLPAISGKTRASAFHILLYSFLLIPVSLVPYMAGITGNISAMLILAAGLLCLFQAWRLYKSCHAKDAKMLMFSSFLYLPIVLIALFVDKI